MALLNETQMFARMAVMRGPVVDTVHDFTTMTLGEFDAAYPLWSGGSKRYCLQANGDYVERDIDKAPLTDLGVWIDGAFVNYSPNGVFSAGVSGTPGTKPTYYDFQGITTPTITIGAYNGLPLFEWEGVLNFGYCASNTAFIPASSGDVLTFSAYCADLLDTPYDAGLYIIDYPVTLRSHVSADGVIGKKTVTRTVDVGTTQASIHLRYGGNIGDTVRLQLCGPQSVKGLGFAPNTLALSSAATTAHTADIIQRAVDLRGPFAVEIVATTAPGDPGAHQTYWCESLGANDYAHIYRATVTHEITIKVRANGVDYSVACGPVADNTQFTLRLGVLFNKVVWSLNESTAASLTIKRSAPYIMETLAALWNATLPGWCSIQSIKVAAGKIATAAEIEGGWS